MESPFRYLRIWLGRADLWPTTRYARFVCWVLGVDVFLILLKRLLLLFGGSYGNSLSGWITLLTIVVISLSLGLIYRWLKAKLLWRLRNRLIVTYVFIGVIPAVLLITMAFVTMYGFAGQFASLIVTSELQSRLRNLGVVNSAIANELAAHIEHGEKPVAESLDGLRRRDPESAPRQFCAWMDNQPLPPCVEHGSAPFSLPSFPSSRMDAYVRDQNNLYLRSLVVLKVKDHTLTVVSSEPLDRLMLQKIAADLGEVTLSSLEPKVKDNQPKSKAALEVQDPNNNFSFTIGGENDGNVTNSGTGVLSPILTVGASPVATGYLDQEIKFATPLSVVDWSTGKENHGGAWVAVQTRPAVLYKRLFAASSDFFAALIKNTLLILAIILTVILAIALFIGTRLTRTVTSSVAQLYLATKYINRGDLSHRIPVKSHDQLSALSISFNSMAESLEKLLEEQKEKQKLQNELAIAQEVQAQLFPQHISQLPSLEVFGFCRPAQTVSGDYYDFLTVDSNRMVMALGDVSGKGISAALLMATIHSAVRAYSHEGIPILRESVAETAGFGALAVTVQGVEVSTAALLTLLNHQLYQSTPTEKYATMFLSYYDGRDRKLTYTNAGHLPPIILGHDGSLRRMDRGGTVVGLFDQIEYEENTIQLYDGDIFLAYSDGVTEPENDYGEFGEQRLIELVWENRQLPLAKICEVVTAAVDDWIGTKEQPDDITLVLARAR